MIPGGWYWPSVAEIGTVVHRCFPERSAREPMWWRTHPTIGIRDHHELVGYTSVSLAPNMIFFYDLAVHPDFRGQGYGRRLHAIRILIGQHFGATMCYGMTQEKNEAMIGLFRTSNFVDGQRIEGHYMDVDPPQDGIPWCGVEPSFEWARAQLFPSP